MSFCTNTFCCYEYLTYFKNSKLALYLVFRKREQKTPTQSAVSHDSSQTFTKPLLQCDEMRPAFHGRGWTEPVGTGLHRLVTRSPQLLFKPSVINDCTHSRVHFLFLPEERTLVQTMTDRLGANRPDFRKETRTDDGCPRFHIQSRSHPLRRELPQRLGGASGLFGPAKNRSLAPGKTIEEAGCQGHVLPRTSPRGVICLPRLPGGAPAAAGKGFPVCLIGPGSAERNPRFLSFFSCSFFALQRLV